MTTVDLATPRVRSYSALSLYMECGWHYKLKYVDKLRDDPAIWNIGGTAFHQCAEWYLTGDPVAAEWGTERVWRLAWDLAVVEVTERDPEVSRDLTTWRAANQGREGVDWWMKNGPLMVDRFIEWKRTKGKDLTLIEGGAEHRFEVVLGGVPVVAIPDALVYDEYGQVNILDWKSGRRPPSGSLQLGVYRAAVLHGWGLNPVWGHYYHTRKAVLLPYDLTQWDPDVIGGMFAEFDARDVAGDYPATPGDHCKFCPATREMCPYSTKEST